MHSDPDILPIQNRLTERDLPKLPAVMYQRWAELLFLHWPVESQIVAEVLPPGLRVDTFEAKAWIGLVPFSMRGVRPRFLPAVPGLSNFPELNLRTYVIDRHGRPGVWFYSLDTPRRIPNWIARSFFHLNYRLARIQQKASEGSCSYQSELWLGTDWDAPQKFQWERLGEAFSAEVGSLEFFLVERYRLFAYNKAKAQLMTGRVHHDAYPLQRVKMHRYSKRLFALNNLVRPEGAPFSILASPGVDVQIFPMQRVD